MELSGHQFREAGLRQAAVLTRWAKELWQNLGLPGKIMLSEAKVSYLQFF